MINRTPSYVSFYHIRDEQDRPITTETDIYSAKQSTHTRKQKWLSQAFYWFYFNKREATLFPSKTNNQQTDALLIFNIRKVLESSDMKIYLKVHDIEGSKSEQKPDINTRPANT